MFFVFNILYPHHFYLLAFIVRIPPPLIYGIVGIGLVAVIIIQSAANFSNESDAFLLTRRLPVVKLAVGEALPWLPSSSVSIDFEMILTRRISEIYVQQTIVFINCKKNTCSEM